MSTKTQKSSAAAKAKTKRGGKRSPSQGSNAMGAGIKSVAFVALGLVILGVIFYASNGGGSSAAEGAADEYEFVVGEPGPGEAAPALQLPSADGDMFDLADLRGKKVLLYFQEGIMCQPCWDQLSDIEANFPKFEALGVDEVVTITTDPLNALEQKVVDEDLSSEVLADPGIGASSDWGAAGIGMMGGNMNGHSFVLVDEEGVIEWRRDYGGPPDYTMYLPVSNLLADMRASTPSS